MNGELTPRRIVAYLDEYIVGQKEAKKSVAVALRNRWRASCLPREIAKEIIPKNRKISCSLVRPVWGRRRSPGASRL